VWGIISTSAQRAICEGYEEDEGARFDYDACIVDKIPSFNVSHSSLPTETTDEDDDATLDEHDSILSTSSQKYCTEKAFAPRDSISVTPGSEATDQSDCKGNKNKNHNKTNIEKFNVIQVELRQAKEAANTALRKQLEREVDLRDVILQYKELKKEHKELVEKQTMPPTLPKSISSTAIKRNDSSPSSGPTTATCIASTITTITARTLTEGMNTSTSKGRRIQYNTDTGDHTNVLVSRKRIGPPLPMENTTITTRTLDQSPSQQYKQQQQPHKVVELCNTDRVASSQPIRRCPPMKQQQYQQQQHQQPELSEMAIHEDVTTRTASMQKKSSRPSLRSSIKMHSNYSNKNGVEKQQKTQYQQPSPRKSTTTKKTLDIFRVLGFNGGKKE